jgi:hypothetical protein
MEAGAMMTLGHAPERASCQVKAWSGLGQGVLQRSVQPGRVIPPALTLTVGHRHLSVMARLVRAIYSSTCAATDGPDKPGHDVAATVSLFAIWYEPGIGRADGCFRVRAGRGRGVCRTSRPDPLPLGKAKAVPFPSWPDVSPGHPFHSRTADGRDRVQPGT